MSTTELAIKIDVDTERGTRIGVPQLLGLFEEHNIHATFLFSLGPDNTGRAIRRIFRPGFLQKVNRTSIVKIYGLKTLCNGVLWPGPRIAKKNLAILKKAATQGHEVGIHAYDHVRWQDGLARMSSSQVEKEVHKAQQAFVGVFGRPATTIGAAGWQATAYSLAAYDKEGFTYASDARGFSPFFPTTGTHVFNTPQIPTTLPTLDELIGRPDHPFHQLISYYLSLIRFEKLNVLTIHAELEGMFYFEWFRQFVRRLQDQGIQIIPLQKIAERLLKNKATIPACLLTQGIVEGRSGALACQGRQVEGLHPYHT